VIWLRRRAVPSARLDADFLDLGHSPLTHANWFKYSESCDGGAVYCCAVAYGFDAVDAGIFRVLGCVERDGAARRGRSDVARFECAGLFVADCLRQFRTAAGSIVAAVILQAVVFGSVHAYQGWKHVLVIVPLGILYGALVAWRGNLRASMMAHTWSDIFEGWLRFV
jgi:hypothetical protein